MARRKIIKIDEARCNGCGLCVPSCHEGAIKIIGGKARLVSDLFCDGLGACLGHCPQGAIAIEEREAADFDREKVEEAFRVNTSVGHPAGFSGCPGSRVIDNTGKGGVTASPRKTASELRQWPVQITLVPVNAPYFKGADLLIAADCVPFAYPDFHSGLLKGKVLLVGCPKLDDIGFYAEKIAAIVKSNDIKSVTYAHMTVPCCYGLIDIIEQAIASSGKNIPFEDIAVGIDGEVKE
jgi:Fe-S-cluster-containing hydrogenase component 2